MREARGWTQPQAAEQLRRHTNEGLPDSGNLTRRWKAWELGENKPGAFYAPIIAAALGTVTAALFPPEHESANIDILGNTGMETLEIVSRLSLSDVNDATLDAIRITVDRLCTEYANRNPVELVFCLSA
jgi:hypothetical protein